ncbi:hypothetical protein ONS95_011938 [Cadophora gregata]|uniref:uncharacterized protein n=1 Tax=Cadophora gregata TaxID=51156 RepID=UPI0026DC4687|nr:uncharacterized protein ONS95_011938 [Cadophora gregata]KAK0117603.1 hypothetical protein ONS95_011938 [Cadophora gregata]
METRFLLRLSQRLQLPPSLRALRPLSTRHHYSTYKPPPSEQANPIGDYYASILEFSTPSNTSAPPTSTGTTPSSSTSPAKPALPTTPASTDPGPSILFSSRLSSPLERRSEIRKQSVLVAGIWVPPKPDEPDNCCMSGCVNCVWDRYGEELEEWAAKRREANEAVRRERSLEKGKGRRRRGAGMVLGEGGVEGDLGAGNASAQVNVNANGAVSMDDDGGGSDTNWGTGLETDFTSEDLFKGVPVGIREFMKQEKRLKEKHAREGTSGG